MSDAGDVANFQVIVSEPDAPAASRIEDINFDGDEEIIVSNTTGVGSYNEAFQASDYGGTNTNNRYSDPAAGQRVVPISLWQSLRSSGSSAQLVFRDLEEVRKTPATISTTGDKPEHVRLVELRVNERRAVQVFGSRTPAGSVPNSGAATFVGEVFGTVVDNNGKLDEFVGDAVITVDFGRGWVGGQITVSHYLFFPLSTPAFRIEFAGTVSGDTFSAQQLTATGGLSDQRATLRGAFFGPAATEVALSLSGAGRSGTVIAGAVAGKE